MGRQRLPKQPLMLHKAHEDFDRAYVEGRAASKDGAAAAVQGHDAPLAQTVPVSIVIDIFSAVSSTAAAVDGAICVARRTSCRRRFLLPPGRAAAAGVPTAATANGCTRGCSICQCGRVCYRAVLGLHLRCAGGCMRCNGVSYCTPRRIKCVRPWRPGFGTLCCSCRLELLLQRLCCWRLEAESPAFVTANRCRCCASCECVRIRLRRCRVPLFDSLCVYSWASDGNGSSCRGSP